MGKYTIERLQANRERSGDSRYMSIERYQLVPRSKHILYLLKSKIKCIIKHEKGIWYQEYGKGFVKLLVPLGTWYLLVLLAIQRGKFSSKQEVDN